MTVLVDGDVILRGVASQVCPIERCDPTKSASDVAAALSAADPFFVTWTLRFPTPASTLQRGTRVRFEVQVMAHGYTRGHAKGLAGDLVAALQASVGESFGGVQVKSARCRQLPTEIRFDGQATTHHRYITTFALSAS